MSVPIKNGVEHDTHIRECVSKTLSHSAKNADNTNMLDGPNSFLPPLDLTQK